MPLQLFLNELSVPREKLARPVEVELLKQLVSTVRAARSIDSALILNSKIPLANFPLGEGSSIATVRNDGECVEESQYLKAINNRAPLKLAATEARAGDPDLCEYRMRGAAAVCAGEVAADLGFAHLFDGLGVSLKSHNFWDSCLVELDLTKMENDGELASFDVQARNANSKAAINHHSDALRATLTPAIQDGEELWIRRTELLTNLVFAPRTQAQLQSIKHGDPVFDQVWTKLKGINEAVEAWKIAKTAHPMFSFNVRPESTSRRSLTRFNDADGVERTFSDHCDFGPIEGRIHFVLETEPTRHAIIGHVGRKLGIG